MANNSKTDTNIDFLGEDDSWETVIEESGDKLVFANVGEQFVGTYVGTEEIFNPKENETFNQQRFRDPDGKLYAINGGFKLQEAVSKLSPGDIVRITLMGEVDMGPGKSPMKDFRVESKKVGAGAPKGAIKEADTADTPIS